jgi:acetyl esterase/lipase
MQIPVPSLVKAEGFPTPSAACSSTATPSSTLVPFPTCTTTPTPYPPGVYGTIPFNYQPPLPYTAVLAWIVFTPTPAPAASPPGIVVIHGAGFHAGDATEATGVCQDLAAKGYYVVSVDYELARCGYIQGQNTHDHDYDGSLPDDMVARQTNDIKAFVNALRNSGVVNPNKIGVLGGSAGATHAIWMALDTTDTGTNWPFWNAAARPQCAVMLSAFYDLSDRTPPNGQDVISLDTVTWTENYVNTADLATLKAKSPVSLVATPTQQKPFVPLYLINSWFDPVAPYHQIVDMICALR